MSVKCISTTIFDVHGLTPTQKLVLLLLSNFCDEKNSCYPSHSYIAHLAGIKSSKHISKIIRELSKQGYLTIKYRYKEDGGNKSNLYILTLERGVLQNPLPLEDPGGDSKSAPNTKDDTKDNIINENFEEFWKIYPRKISKYQAKQKYYLITKDYDHIKLKEMLIKFIAHCEAEKTDMKYIPHAATWLNQRRFYDYEQIDLKDIKKVAAVTQERQVWTNNKNAPSEQRIVSSWAIEKETQNYKVDPKTSEKLAEIAAKHNLKGKNR